MSKKPPHNPIISLIPPASQRHTTGPFCPIINFAPPKDSAPSPVHGTGNTQVAQSKTPISCQNEETDFITPSFCKPEFSSSSPSTQMAIPEPRSPLPMDSSKLLQVPSPAMTPGPIVPSAPQIAAPSPKIQQRPYDIGQTLIRSLPMRMVGEALHVFNGRAFEFVSEEVMRRLIMRYCRESVRASGFASVIGQVYDIIKSEPDICVEAAVQEDFVSFANCLLDTRDFSCHPHTPNIFVTAQVQGNFLPDNPPSCPVFDQFLYSVTQGNPELIQRIWEMIGYALVPDTRGKCIFILQGPRDSGKSLLGNFISSLFRPEDVTALGIEDLGKNFGPADLVGKRLNCCLDMAEGLWDSASTGMLKRLTGGDPVSADVKYHPRIKFRNRATFIFATNHAVGTQSNDNALMRRLICIPFSRTVPFEAQDFTLAEKLQPERDAVITKALFAYRNLRSRGYRFSGHFPLNEVIATTSTGAMSSFFNLDQAIADFFYQQCELDPNAKTFTSDAYAAFQSSTTGSQSVTLSVFSSKLGAFLNATFQGQVKKGRDRKTPSSNPTSLFEGIRLKSTAVN